MSRDVKSGTGAGALRSGVDDARAGVTDRGGAARSHAPPSRANTAARPGNKRRERLRGDRAAIVLPWCRVRTLECNGDHGKLA